MRALSSLLSLALLSSLLAVSAKAQTETESLLEPDPAVAAPKTADAPSEAAPVSAPAGEQAPAMAPTGDQTELSPPAQVVGGSRVLTLAEAIERAMSRSFSVAQAEAARDAQKEARRAALSNLGPNARVLYNEAHFEDAQTVNFNNNLLVTRGKVSKTGSLIVTQPITGLYGYIEASRASGLQAEITEEGLRKAKADAGFSGAQAFLNAYGAQEQVTISEASMAAAKSAFHDATVMNRVGRINQADFLKFQLAYTQAQTRNAQAKASRSVAMAVLRQTLQMPPEETITLQPGLPSPKLTAVAVEEAIQTATKNRPDLKQAEMSAEYASFAKKLAYTDFIPTVDLFGQLDRNFGELTALGGNEKDVKYYGVKMQWTFWNNGASVFKVREAAANTRRADAAYAAAKDGVRIDVIQAVENLQAASESLKQAEAGIKQAEEAYRIDEVRYKNGGITASDRILSESTKSTVQGQYVSARTQLLSWYFELQRALGQEKPTL